MKMQVNRLIGTLKYFFPLICFLVFNGCETQRETLDSWKGHSKTELYRAWGPPSRVTEDGAGGEILIYAVQDVVPAMPSLGIYQNINYWDYTFMYVGGEGSIYYWRTSRERIPPQQIDLYIHRR